MGYFRLQFYFTFMEIWLLGTWRHISGKSHEKYIFCTATKALQFQINVHSATRILRVRVSIGLPLISINITTIENLSLLFYSFIKKWVRKFVLKIFSIILRLTQISFLEHLLSFVFTVKKELNVPLIKRNLWI